MTINNAGTFTAYNTTSITGTASDVFNNSGTFDCGDADGSGVCVLNLAFNNSGQVNIQAGTLTLQSGSSSKAWSIADTAALILAGGGSGTNAQAYVFNAGSSFSYPVGTATSGTSTGRQYGAVIVNGSNAGGLCVQTALSINQLYLVNGTISGYGDLTVTGQMVWSGGTMTSVVNPNDSKFVGSLTIAAGAALFTVGMEGSDGQVQVPVLGRPVNILGDVGWVGSNGSIKSVNDTFNSQPLFQKGLLGEVPPPTPGAICLAISATWWT